MKGTGTILRIELHGEEADDGRILFESPDLEGYYFVVKRGEQDARHQVSPMKIAIDAQIMMRNHARRTCVTAG